MVFSSGATLNANVRPSVCMPVCMSGLGGNVIWKPFLCDVKVGPFGAITI